AEAITGDVAPGPVVLADHIRRPEPRDRGLLVRPGAAGCGAVGLDLVEGRDPLIALERGWRLGQELVHAPKEKAAHVPYPRHLRRCERRRQAPDARTRWQRREGS